MGFTKDNPIERRSEDRRIVNKFYTVELLIHEVKFEYRFRIWDITSKGISLLINEDSDMLNYLKVGDILHLRYHTGDSSKPIGYLKTVIKHISKADAEQFERYLVVGLSILQEEGYEREKYLSVVCPSCNTGYRIPSSRIPQKRTVGTCRKCGVKIVIKP